MTTKEAVEACEFWTTNIAETIAIGTTRNPLVGLHFEGEEYHPERWSNPGKRGWSITIPRWIVGEEIGRVENEAYRMIVAEIERRRVST